MSRLFGTAAFGAKPPAVQVGRHQPEFSFLDFQIPFSINQTAILGPASDLLRRSPPGHPDFGVPIASVYPVATASAPIRRTGCTTHGKGPRRNSRRVSFQHQAPPNFGPLLREATPLWSRGYWTGSLICVRARCVEGATQASGADHDFFLSVRIRVQPWRIQRFNTRDGQRAAKARLLWRPCPPLSVLISTSWFPGALTAESVCGV